MAVVAVLQVALAGQPIPKIDLVQPSSNDVPANLLRLSVVFDEPIEGDVLPQLALSRADGTLLQEPFLQQKLWSPDGRILTVLLHPGRVKTGLVAHEQWGPILNEGDDVVLTFDGQPIKRWHVGPIDNHGPVASAWTLSQVSPGSMQPLVVTLDGPIDGRDVDFLAVVSANDQLVDGKSQLRDGEKQWVLTPEKAWRTGNYRLIVRGTLEDPSGNRLGGRFETPLDSPQSPATDDAVAFKVGSQGTL